jgi:hypothetical protein
MGCRSLVSFMTLASIHSSHTHCFCSHGSSTLQFQHVARLILMWHTCGGIVPYSLVYLTCCVRALLFAWLQLRFFWAQLHLQLGCTRALLLAWLQLRSYWAQLQVQRTTLRASLRILWYILLVVCGPCYLLGFSCGSFGPSSAHHLVARGPCFLLGFSCGPIGPSFKCNVLLCERWWWHIGGDIVTYSLVYLASCARALLFAWLQLRFFWTQLRIQLG